MKAAFILLAFSGFILSINADCDKNACKTYLDDKDCTKMQQYVDCMNKEADGCKATAHDVGTKLLIEGMIGTEKAAMLVLSCGACTLTVSATTLLIAVIAAYIRM